MRDNDGIGTIIKMDFINDSMWKSRMKDLLFYKDFYDPIEEQGVKLPYKFEEDWKKKNKKIIDMLGN